MSEPKKTGPSILLLVVMAGYIGVKDVVVPLVAEVTGKKGATELSLDQKIGRLESVTFKLERIPEQVAIQSEAISNLKAGVERLEKKIDSHIVRDKQ